MQRMYVLALNSCRTRVKGPFFIIFLFFFFFFTSYYYIFLFNLHFLWHLFPGHKFLSLLLLLGYLFLLCNLFWFRNNLLFFSKDHLHVAGRTLVCADLTRSCLSPVLHLGSFIHLMCSMTKHSTSKPLSSALLSEFLNMCNKDSPLFLGHEPCIQAHCLTCAAVTSTVVTTERHTLLL